MRVSILVFVCGVIRLVWPHSLLSSSRPPWETNFKMRAREKWSSSVGRVWEHLTMRNYTTETVIPVLSHISHCHADCHTVTNCDTGSTNHSSHHHSHSTNNANRVCHHGLYDTNFIRNRKTGAKFREECHWDVKLGPPSEMMTVAVIWKYLRYLSTGKDINQYWVLSPSRHPSSVCLTEGGEYSDAATLLVGIPPSCSSQWRCALALCSHLHNGQSSICWLNDIGPWSEPQLGLEEESAAVSQGILWAGLYQGLDQWQKKGVALSAFPDSQGEKTHHKLFKNVSQVKHCLHFR